MTPHVPCALQIRRASRHACRPFMPAPEGSKTYQAYHFLRPKSQPKDSAAPCVSRSTFSNILCRLSLGTPVRWYLDRPLTTAIASFQEYHYHLAVLPCPPCKAMLVGCASTGEPCWLVRPEYNITSHALTALLPFLNQSLSARNTKCNHCCPIRVLVSFSFLESFAYAIVLDNGHTH